MMRSGSRQRGFALINVLVIILALSALALGLLRDATRSNETVMLSQRSDQLALYADAAVDFAAALLEKDLRSSDFDHLAEAWALTDYRAEIGDTFVSVTVRDLEAKFNLNLLIAADPASAVQALQDLAASRGSAPELVAALAARFAPFQPGPGEVVDTSEGQHFQEGDLLHISEFPALASDETTGLGAVVATLPRGRPVNVNTAPRDVLAAVLGLDEAAADALLALRDATPFETMSDVTDAVMALTGDAGNVQEELVGIQSQWFEVLSVVSLEGLTHRRRTVLFRDPSEFRVHVFWHDIEVTG